jgi:hypothetical protein
VYKLSGFGCGHARCAQIVFQCVELHFSMAVTRHMDDVIVVHAMKSPDDLDILGTRLCDCTRVLGENRSSWEIGVSLMNVCDVSPETGCHNFATPSGLKKIFQCPSMALDVIVCHCI